MQILIWSIVFLVALAALIKSADYFTAYSEKIGKILGIPQFIIGVSIVAVGTSLPELTTSILATFRGYSSIVSANVVGSNIANVLLIIGITSIYARQLVVEKSLIKLDLPILSAITALLIVTLYDGSFTAFEGIIMLLGYGVYIAYNLYEHKQSRLAHVSKTFGETLGDAIGDAIKKDRIDAKLIGLLALSTIGIYFGADYTIKSIIALSEILNLAPAAIAISAVAVGTSLPELLVSIQAARRNNHEMVFGNIIGSNIFNATVVMGVPAFITTLSVGQDVITIAIPFLIISTILLVFSGIEKRLFSFEGALYCLLYFVFIGQLFNFL